MAKNNDHRNKIAQARQLLSPYLDGEVTAAEQQLVEEALTIDPDLQAELESLQTTVDWLHELPAVVPPRPFTLSEADVQPKRSAGSRSWLVPDWLKLWGTAAPGLLCILAVGGVLLLQQMRGGMLSAPAGDVAMLEEAAETQAIEPEMEKVEEMPAEAEPLPQSSPVTGEGQADEVEEEAEESIAAEADRAEAIEIEPEAAVAETEAEATAETSQSDAEAPLAAEEAAEPAPIEKAAPVPERREAEQPEESLNLAQPAEEIPQADDKAGAPVGGTRPESSPPPPPEIESLAAPPAGEAPRLEDDSATPAIEAEEAVVEESREAAAPPTATATVTATATLSPAPTAASTEAVIPTEVPADTGSTRTSTAFIVFLVAGLVLVGVGAGLWLMWRKQSR